LIKKETSKEQFKPNNRKRPSLP